MAKLPVKVAEYLNKINEDEIPFVVNILVHYDEDCLEKWFTEKPKEYYEGLLHAKYETISDMLMVYKCYRGFKFCNKNGFEYRHYFL